jgi:hypothetical protein
MYQFWVDGQLQEGQTNQDKLGRSGTGTCSIQPTVL